MNSEPSDAGDPDDPPSLAMQRSVATRESVATRHSVATRPLVGRFAPSPTGAQHLGNARTYLIAYWAARSAGGSIRMRIEDVDSPRVKPWAIQQAIDDLLWLGLSWDGEIVVQTERRQRYRQLLDQMIAANFVYPCKCTRKDIEAAGSAPHFEHEQPIYPGTCSGWRGGDPLPEPGKFAWRFRTPDRQIKFIDQLHGSQLANVQQHLGDFPITQKSGEVSYQFAVVVDDADAGVNHVVRGDDLLTSTFRQIAVAESLSLSIPSYLHVPLVLGPDGRRLAKRHGDTRLSSLRDDGVEAMQVVDWAARSSGVWTKESSVRDVDEVSEVFAISRLRRDAVIADPDRLNWLGKP